MTVMEAMTAIPCKAIRLRDRLPDEIALLATAYLRLLSRRLANPATTGHLARSEDSSDSASERLDFVAGSPMTCAGRDGGRNANPSKELR